MVENNPEQFKPGEFWWSRDGKDLYRITSVEKKYTLFPICARIVFHSRTYTTIQRRHIGDAVSFFNGGYVYPSPSIDGGDLFKQETDSKKILKLILKGG